MGLDAYLNKVYAYPEGIAFGNNKIVIITRTGQSYSGGDAYMGFVIINYNTSSGFSLYKSYITTNIIGSQGAQLCFFNNNFFALIADSSFNALLFKSSNGENFYQITSPVNRIQKILSSPSYLMMNGQDGLIYSSDGTTFTTLPDYMVFNDSSLTVSDIIAIRVSENGVDNWKEFKNGAVQSQILYSGTWKEQFYQYGNYQYIFTNNNGNNTLKITNKSTGENVTKSFKTIFSFPQKEGNYVDNKIFFAARYKGVAYLDCEMFPI